jgi:isoamylase
MPIRALPGFNSPLGATIRPGGVNFCVFSGNATGIELLLYDHPEDPQPARAIRLDPDRNRTFHYWHTMVPDIGPGQVYAYRAHGPFAPEEGHRFDGGKVLLDPYARAVVTPSGYSRAAAARPGDNTATAMRCVVVDPRGYDWEDDVPLHRPLAGSVIYEMHVRGFTRHPSSGVVEGKRGTYAGLIEKALYLQELGVSAVELLPVQQFDEQAAPHGKDYWGYNPIAFFAPHCGYSSNRDPLGPVNEFRDMVKAMHRAGIEVILDIVFNHTAEGGRDGPTLSFRGLENSAYYILASDRSRYADYTGCGNTFNGNNSVVRRLILDCLHYWVQVMHVDGFRFDLASVLSRDEWGQPLRSPPILWDIDSDPILAGTKIIAEAWDAAGLYQVGRFVGERWAEWNGPFRDDVRRFVRADIGSVRPLAARLAGSPDLYKDPARDAHRGINFITCHDGFTLYDLVSYGTKHNEANGERNRDGSDQNLSWNCGVEGPTSDAAINGLRSRQMKNLLTLLMLSQGTPMLLMGDAGCRTQQGNNNAYCQDNEISWVDWDLLHAHADMHRFVQGLIYLRRSHSPFRSGQFWATPDGTDHAPLTWHGVQPFRPDWGADSHTLAFSLHCGEHDDMIYVACNAYWQSLDFRLPALAAGKQWHRVVDTNLSPPDDIAERGAEVPLTGGSYGVAPRSVLVLLGR